MIRPVPALALDFLRRAEGCRLDAYQDAGGVWTAGYGHTGEDVKSGQRYSQPQADAWLARDANIAATRLASRVATERLAALSEHQYAALVSFVFNLGASPGWTLWRLLNKGQLDQVPVQILRFDKVREPDGQLKTLPGLAHRRTAEVALWRLPDAAVAAAIAIATPQTSGPSAQTRSAETPPAPMPSAAGRVGSVGATVATAVAAAPVAISQAQGSVQAISNAISPYSDKSEILQHAIAALACLCAGLAALAVMLQWLHHNAIRRG
jgi:lysozyme